MSKQSLVKRWSARRAELCSNLVYGDVASSAGEAKGDFGCGEGV